MSAYTDADVQAGAEAIVDMFPGLALADAKAVLDAVAPAIAARALREYADELADRLERARDTLNNRTRDAWSELERRRLDGKANGVALALSYLEELRRSLRT